MPEKNKLKVVHRKKELSELQKLYNHDTSDLVEVLYQKKLEKHISETKKEIDSLMKVVPQDRSTKQELETLLKEEKSSVDLYNKIAS